MKIRSQLLLAFLLLSVLPLGGVVGYSFYTSQETIQRAAAAEAKQLSEELRRRVGDSRLRLEQRLAQVPWESLIADPARPADPVLGNWLREALGDEDGAVRSLTIVGTGDSEEDSNQGPIWQLQLDGEGESLGDQPLVKPLPPLPPKPRFIPSAPASPVFPDGLDELEDPSGPGASGLRLDLDLEDLDLEDLDLKGLGPGELGIQETLLELIDQGLKASVEASEVVEGESIEAEAGKTARWAMEMARHAAATQREQLRVERQALKTARLHEKARLVLGENPGVEIIDAGQVIGQVRTEVDPDKLLSGIFADAEREPDEIPFALDAEGRLYTEPGGDRRRLQALGVSERGDDHWFTDQWVVASSVDPVTGLRLGVARPVGDSLQELRTTALRNLIAGLALIFMAVLGMLPLSHRLSAGIQRVASGADRIASGDLDTRVPVTGGGEMAHLARSFNSMASDLRQHQVQLVSEERLRRDREVEQEIMQRELERQSTELEEARQFQLSLLPQNLPVHPSFEVAVHHETATEVGGDYYDFRLNEDGQLLVALGDATGHGARAGTMVTVIKSLFSGLSSAQLSPSELLTKANRAVRRMHLERMTMALVAVELDRYRLRFANAGMPPMLHHESATGRIDELLIPGMPLGGLATNYDQQVRVVAPGDTLLLFSDGLPEQPDVHGEPTGYQRVSELFASLVGDVSKAHSVEHIAAGLAAAVRELTLGRAPFDDVSFVVLRVR